MAKGAQIRFGSDASNASNALEDAHRASSKLRARMQLRKWTWECSRFMSHDEIRAFVDGVIEQIEQIGPDEP